jgi:SAM-dependent methyltransferase
VSNISVLVGEPEDPKIPPGSVDLAVMVNVLTAPGGVNTRNFLGNLARGLKPDGRLVIIEWDPVKLQQVTARQFEPELRRMLRPLEDAPFEVVKTLDFLPRQSLRICRYRRVE